MAPSSSFDPPWTKQQQQLAAFALLLWCILVVAGVALGAQVLHSSSGTTVDAWRRGCWRGISGNFALRTEESIMYADGVRGVRRLQGRSAPNKPLIWVRVAAAAWISGCGRTTKKIHLHAQNLMSKTIFVFFEKWGSSLAALWVVFASFFH